MKKYENQYGTCCICGYLGTLEYHHILPKSLTSCQEVHNPEPEG
jgi:5-methylcytosine-specific restriction endonuclease McrA